MSVRARQVFVGGPDFCGHCGSILTLGETETGEDDQFCQACHSPVIKEDEYVNKYVVHFNDRDVYTRKKSKAEKRIRKKCGEEKAEGPIVDRECKECGNKQMSYATLQLRSVDEGQTVFYTCTKCKFKESENS